ncbi:MAG: sialate O-acetylesterase [Lachnospiraceae bacterium]|nr:sialate O-acetylesterase [Lachnospiraceae bacterium]
MSRIQLPQIYQNHMMLQRDKPLHIRGTAPSASVVTIVLEQTRIQCPVSDGKFSCRFPAQPAGRDKALYFYIEEQTEPDIVLTHISIGDIWLAAGQSNMEFFLRYDAHWNDTRRLSSNPDIHMYNCPQLAFEGQQKDLPDSGRWFQEGDRAWATFSAPGYSFARSLQPDLKVPVGIIGCNWGGTPACAWMDEEALRQPHLDIFFKEYEAEISVHSTEELEQISRNALAFEYSYRHQLEWRAVMYGLTSDEQQTWMKEHKDDPVLPMGPFHHYRPCGLYHTMVQKLAPFSLKGILWYQGESDSNHADIYDKTMKSLIACFRRTWQDEALPFLFVQLAPFGRWLDCGNEGYARIRSKQELISKTVPGTAMVSIMDLGMYEDIHPKFKMEVGERLALLAKGKVYGIPGLCESPEFLAANREGNQIILSFSNTGEGLHSEPYRFVRKNQSIKNLSAPENRRAISSFRILQSGQPLNISDIWIQKDQILLTLPEMHSEASSDPVEISFAEENYCEVSIWNEANLPLKPFHCTVQHA